MLVAILPERMTAAKVNDLVGLHFKLARYTPSSNRRRHVDKATIRGRMTEPSSLRTGP